MLTSVRQTSCASVFSFLVSQGSPPYSVTPVLWFCQIPHTLASGLKIGMYQHDCLQSILIISLSVSYF